MKPIWYIIALLILLISTIRKMTDSVSDILITFSIIALVALFVWLYDTGRIKINVRFKKILKKIGLALGWTVLIAYIALMACFGTHKLITERNPQVILVFGIAGIVLAISWHINRWRRWWVKFLKTFMPKDKINPAGWKPTEVCFSIFDYESNARYELRPADGIFRGRARVWLDKQKLYGSARLNATLFEDILKRENIEARVILEYLPGCIYSDIVAETNYKSMNSHKQTAFRAAFYWLRTSNYRGAYYVRYEGDYGTIFFECYATNSITRAIRTKPIEEYYLDYTCGFQSEEAKSFIERGVDWSEGTCSMISKKEFFNLWQKIKYKDKDVAFSFFYEASLIYFASVANDDENERVNSSWDIENAAKYLIAHNETEIMIELLNLREETMYWAARLFREIFPAEAQNAALNIIENSDNPYILSRTKRLLSKWKKEGNSLLSS